MPEFLKFTAQTLSASAPLVEGAGFTEDMAGKVADVINKGGLVILPTDTVYGIAGDAYSHAVFTKISFLKSRPRDKAFPIQVGKAEDAVYLSDRISLAAMLLMKRLWPGALTVVVKAAEELPFFLKSPEGKIGIRVPCYAPLERILAKIRRPLIVTSANKSGEKSPVFVEEVAEEIKKKVDLILDGGRTLLGRESTVVDLTGDAPRLLREGAFGKERLREALSIKKIIFVCTGNSCRSVMARYYIEKLFKEKGISGIETDSAGIGTVDGFEASSLALEVLREEGMDASSHRTKRITEELISESDLVVVMGEIHSHFLQEKFPESMGKIRLLGGFSPQKSSAIEISDPIGQGKDVYRQCLLRIKTGLDGLLKELTQLDKAFAG